MHKAVIDTNVFISGVLYGGNPQSIIEAWLNKKYTFCLSPELKSEIINKLQNKFFLPARAIQDIEEALDAKTEKYIPKKKLFVCKDATDNFVLELALEAQANYLIIGDKLVLKLKQYKNTKILSPKDFLKLLES